MIWRPEVPFAKEMYDAMYWAEERMVAEAGLETGDAICLKTGYTDAVMHESAIIEVAGAHPFLMVLYTNAGYSDEVRLQIAQFVQRLRQAFIEMAL